MVAQIPLAFALSTEIPRPIKEPKLEKLKVNNQVPVKGKIEAKGKMERPVAPVPGAADFLPLPNSKPLTAEQRERENLVLAWLNEQECPVTITQMTEPPAKTENGIPVIGDHSVAGGLGIQNSQIRLVLHRLHQLRKVTRLQPRENETAQLWVGGWVDVSE